ncbi:unnamed protein product [Choristocarpus tenellus]
MTSEEATRSSFNPFDVTKVWPHDAYPLREVGRMTLNRNPSNYFAEVEQMAYAPSNMIPGIEPSPDKMLQQGRLFSYNDTHRHRLGANYEQLSVNRPFNSSVSVYSRDGPMRLDTNMAGTPNYFPNSFSGPQPLADASHTTWKTVTVSGEAGRYPTGEDDNFSQCGDFFRKTLCADARERLTDNIAGAMAGAQEFIQKRAIANFAAADADYGRMIAQKVQKINNSTSTSRPKPKPKPLNPPRTIPKAYSGQAKDQSNL